MHVIFLGTSGAIPTPERNLPSVAISRKGELILFDVGEATQRQMISAHVGFRRKTKIFITHMHGDHVLGLPGLFQTMSLLDRSEPIKIFGPHGTCKYVNAITKTVRFTLTFPIETFEVEEGIVCEEEEYNVYATWADHVIPNLAYALIEKQRAGRFYPEKALALGIPEGPLWSKLQHGEVVTLPSGTSVRPEDVMGSPRPGRKVVYSGDTRPTRSLVKLAHNADLLIHDCTFDDKLAEKAKKDGHSTPSQAAQIAAEANVKRLVLLHISARYDNATILEEQAKRIFPNTQVAYDLMKVDVPYAE